MTNIILYTTAGCHLCELAESLLLQAKQQNDFLLISTEIADDDELIAQYGTYIPVIEFQDGSQLNWPFELNNILAKL